MSEIAKRSWKMRYVARCVLVLGIAGCGADADSNDPMYGGTGGAAGTAGAGGASGGVGGVAAVQQA
jgi:hypothetical protein